MLLDYERQQRNEERQGRSPNRGDNEQDDDSYLSVSRLRTQYLDYLGSKILEIEEQKEARHYYHGAQWSAAEIRIMRKRHQPVVTFNLIGKKINAVVGLVERLRQDPKAYPRNPRNDAGAEVSTACIRYVTDQVDWKTKSSECARHAGIEGIAGVELKLIEGDHGDPDIGMEIVNGDDFFYDPRSIRYDFSDARYKGLAKWLDVEEVIELFPDKEEELNDLIEHGSDLTTNSDREHKWILSTERRIRLVEHWYKRKGEWYWAFHVGTVVLDQGISPFTDERNKTFCRFRMFSAAVDHDGDRYGLTRNMKSPQDEANQRRARMLALSNARRLIGEKGAVDDVERARKEWARHDGYIEVNQGRKITPDDTSGELAAQKELFEQAVGAIEQLYNVTPATSNGEMPRNMSGRAINLLQQAGIAELGPFILAYRSWKIGVYRDIWNLCKNFWTAERWIRITDEEGLAQFIQLNGLERGPDGRPAIVNAVGNLDVDIILDEGPDVINMMSDTYDMLSSLAASGANVPPQVLIELSPIQGSVKRKVLKMMNPPVDPAKEEMKRLAIAELAAKADKEKGQAMKYVAQAAESATKAHLNADEIYQRSYGFATEVEPMPPPQPQPQMPSGPVPPMPGQPSPPPGGYSAGLPF